MSSIALHKRVFLTTFALEVGSISSWSKGLGLCIEKHIYDVFRGMWQNVSR